jgi:hypothetical protein
MIIVWLQLFGLLCAVAAKEQGDIRELPQRMLHKTSPISINLKAGGGGANSPLSNLLGTPTSPGSPGSPASPGSPGSPGSPESPASPGRLCPTPQTSPVSAAQKPAADKANSITKKVGSFPSLLF